MSTTGDPLADAVIDEQDLRGAQVRQALDAGLAHGLASLGGEPPTAVAALLADLETTPSWVDPEMLRRGDAVSLAVPSVWLELCSLTCALTHVYASPAIARLLAREGEPAALASRRVAEAGAWTRQVVQPGGLLRGAPGYLATVRVRLRNARLRRTALEHGWDTSARGLPISQADLARTWLGFTLVSFQGLAAVGIDTTPREELHLYRYWSYVAHLLGIDETLHRGVADHSEALGLQDVLECMTAAPDDDSRALTAVMIDAQAQAVADAPGAVLSEEQARGLIHVVLQRTFEGETMDALGIPAAAAADYLPLIRRLPPGPLSAGSLALVPMKADR